MYCIHCGVKLAQVQTICPLCGTKMVLPEEFQPEPPMYPENKYPKAEKRQLWPQGIIAAAFLLPMLIVVICDYQMGSLISWSGYVVGALLVNNFAPVATLDTIVGDGFIGSITDAAC